MKYLFIITGIGLGHALREKAIIDEILKRQTNSEIHIATYGTALNYFKKFYQTTKIFGHRFQGTDLKFSKIKFFFSNIGYPFTYVIDLIHLIKLIKKLKPDKVIIDVQPVGIAAAKLTRREIISIYNLDTDRLKKKEITNPQFIKLIKKVYKKSDKVIIPVLTQNKGKKKNIYYINPIVRSSPKDLPPKQKLMKKLNLKKEPILVTIGGSQFGLPIIKTIIKIAPKFDEHFIIFGIDYKDKNVIGYKFKENFLEYLKISKAVITTAGHNTLSEILIFKKPAIIFQIKNYTEQIQNAELVKDAKLSLVSNFTEDSKIIERLIRKLLKNKDKLIKNLNKLNVKASGASEAFNIISNNT